MPPAQNKDSEIRFFDSHGASKAYDVFSASSNERIVELFMRLGGLVPGARVADLGCGSGTLTDDLQRRGMVCTGIDLSPKLIGLARERYPAIEFIEGDVEHLPFADSSFDAVVLAGVLHHLPDRTACVAEIKRVLRPGGRFVAFDPNRMNPFMYLYRDRSSPFYSPVGVTENERPVLADDLAATFREAGFTVGTEYHSGLKYRYLAAEHLRWLLPAYNFADAILFAPAFMARHRAFVFTYGEKPKVSS